MPARVITAAQVSRMKHLRGLGLSASGVGQRLGIPESTVRNWWNSVSCVDCDDPVDRSSSKGAAVRCERCSHAHQASEEERARVTYWTRERLIAAIQWWVKTYGETPALPDWCAHISRHVLHDEPRARRAERLITDRTIPGFTTVVQRFGSWNAGIEAAGFQPRVNHGGGGNSWRRRSSRKELAA